MWSNVGSERWQHVLMVREQSNCKTGMGHYGIFREVFIRGSEVLLLRRPGPAKRGLAAMTLLAPAEFLPGHIISNVENACMVQDFERLPAASLIAGIWKTKSHPL